jgi:CDP-diglyceride synthetase
VVGGVDVEKVLDIHDRSSSWDVVRVGVGVIFAAMCCFPTTIWSMFVVAVLFLMIYTLAGSYRGEGMEGDGLHTLIGSIVITLMLNIRRMGRNLA